MADITGGDERDILQGGEAADRVFGLGGDDVLAGGAGNDSLYGGEGDDWLDGEAGRDLIDGGAGFDTARYAGVGAAILFDLAAGRVSFPTRAWGFETLVSVEGIEGGLGNDTFLGTAAADAFDGGAGDDLIVATAGADTIAGGDGRDTIDYRSVAGAVAIDLGGWPTTVGLADGTRQAVDGVEVFLLGSGADSFVGDRGETVHGGDGNDTLRGGSFGDDRLMGEGGNDWLEGGDGNDTLQGGAGNDTLDGGAGTDLADYSDTTANIVASLATASVTFPGRTWRAETIVNFEGLAGGLGNDRLTGDGAANLLMGGEGRDTLVGGGGNDTLMGGSGNDRIEGGAGRDTVSYADSGASVRVDLGLGQASFPGRAWAAETLVSVENAVGGVGNDQLLGSAAANLLDGGAGNDTLTGRGGDDTFLLSAGADVIDGGAGTDALLVRLDYDEFAWVTSEIDFGDGAETYETVSGRTDDSLLVDLGTGVVVDHYTGASARIANVENVTTGVGNDRVLGSEAPNVIAVGHGANFVNGRGGDDVITGSGADPAYPNSVYFTDERDAAEVLRGGNGNDTVTGGSSMFGDAGNDTLVCGWPGSAMTGGAGADRFVFSDRIEWADDPNFWAVAERGTIRDFDAAEGDRIAFARADDGAPLPEFVGTVGSRTEVGVGQIGYVDEGPGRTFLYLALLEDPNSEEGWNYGVQVYTSTAIRESDILFV